MQPELRPLDQPNHDSLTWAGGRAQPPLSSTHLIPRIRVLMQRGGWVEMETERANKRPLHSESFIFCLENENRDVSCRAGRSAGVAAQKATRIPTRPAHQISRPHGETIFSFFLTPVPLPHAGQGLRAGWWQGQDCPSRLTALLKLSLSPSSPGSFVSRE